MTWWLDSGGSCICVLVLPDHAAYSTGASSPVTSPSLPLTYMIYAVHATCLTHCLMPAFLTGSDGRGLRDSS